MQHEHIIWQNIDVVPDKDYYLTEFPERFKGLTEEEIKEKMYEMALDDNDRFLDDERMNLDIKLDNPILVIADLGLWNGRFSGYKVIKSGNIRDILFTDNADSVKWYSDGRNIKAEAHHHDGVNYLEYREIVKPDTIHKLTDDIYEQKDVSRQRLNYYTKSIAPEVKQVYGW